LFHFFFAICASLFAHLGGFLHLTFGLQGAVCSGSWTLYGSLVGDVYVMTPNGMGFVLSVIQILVIGRYSNQLAMCGFSQAPMQGQLNSDTLV
jgi:hypothetical protein